MPSFNGTVVSFDLEGDRKRGKGAEVWNGVRKEGRCGTYNVGVKDLASAYVLCPCKVVIPRRNENRATVYAGGRKCG